MILHVWMHWFWITVSWKCFLHLTVQMISLSYISEPFATGAGLLDNETLVSTLTPPPISGTTLSNVTLYILTESSQVEAKGNTTHLPTEPSLTTPTPPSTSSSTPSAPSSSSASPILSSETTVATTEIASSSSTVETTSLEMSTSGPTMSTGLPEMEGNESISRSDDSFPMGETSDVEDTFNGGTLDVYQYPMKKSTKYSSLKYGKTRVDSPKAEDGERAERVEKTEEAVREEEEEESKKNVEEIKIVEEEKLKINISLTGNGTLEPVVLSPVGDHKPVLGNETRSGNGSITSTTESEVTSTTSATTTTTSATRAAEVLLDGDDENDAVDRLRNESLVIENKVEESVIHTTIEPFPLRNRVAAATSSQNFELASSGMNAGSVTGITLGILVVFTLFGAISFVLYRRRYLNKPQVLHDKCSNLDSSGYIDDASLKENSEEMYSLDNDSFLNSLEAMTIQNYWTESVKHTKL